MKVLALNGSPRMKASSTYRILTPLLEGMEVAGAETEVVHIRRLSLEACIGCYNCWVRTPGECVHRDGMSPALKKFNEADIVVFGTSLYHYSMTGIMKDFIDRLLPRFEPWLIPHPSVPNVSGHPERFRKPTRMFLVSPCGFPEFDHFEALVTTFKQIARMEGWEYMGEILRPAAEPLSRPSLQPLFGEYYARVRRAGEELIREGGISDALQAELGQDLFPGGADAFHEVANDFWTAQMDKASVPEELRHVAPLLAGDMDSPATPSAGSDEVVGRVHAADRTYVPNEILMQTMAAMYDPAAIPNLRATIQFHIAPPALTLERNGELRFDPGALDWYLEIGDSGCIAKQGLTAIPSLTVSTPYEVWYDIGMGSLDALDAFTEGKYEAIGSQRLIAELLRLFPRPEPAEGDSPSTDLDAIMQRLPDAFASLDAGNVRATVQLILGGRGGGLYFLDVHDSGCDARRGSVGNATMTIQCPVEVWLELCSGRSDTQEAVAAGRLRVSGDSEFLPILSKMIERVRD